MAASFNIDRFMEGSGQVDLSDIDWSSVPKHPLTPAALRTIRYFLLTESSTFFYTKALLGTDISTREPEFAPFICAWMYEEEFHGRAFRRFLEAYGEAIPSDYRVHMFRARTTGERIDELGQLALAQVFPEAWPALHMAWGTIQELTTYYAYQALIERVDHPILQVICQRIMKQELRHYAFYREHAKKRLAVSAVARKITAAALRLAWTPVGDGMCPTEETHHLVRFLFDGVDGTAIGRIERKIRELPGLESFDRFTRYAADRGLRKGPPEWIRGRARQADTDDAADAAVAS